MSYAPRRIELIETPTRLGCYPAAHKLSVQSQLGTPGGVEHEFRQRNGVGVICVAPSGPNGSTTAFSHSTLSPGRDKPLASRRLGTEPLLKLTELGLPFFLLSSYLFSPSHTSHT